MTTKVASPFAVTPGSKLLGEIITWSCSGVTIRHTDLIAALRDAGLDESVARELAPRSAFTRACKKLGEDRIIRAISEDAHTITFQFTKESRASDSYLYTLETRLALQKGTGKVVCDLPGLATLAQDALDQCIASRTGADITRTIQRLFERHADLFPIREHGGCYFCPAEHAVFLDQIDSFVKRLNGTLRRFPVPAGTPHGDRSVKEAVTAGLAALIVEHRAAVEAFGEDTRSGTVERAAERIRQTRFKVEAYAAYLAEERTKLDRDLAATARRLREGRRRTHIRSHSSYRDPRHGLITFHNAERLDSMTAIMNEIRPVTERDRLYVQSPTLWPAWPFLPVIRATADGDVECGLMYDCWTIAQRPGYSATVFLCNYFLMPNTEDEFFECPKQVYDNPEELLADGWRVD